MSVDEPCPTCGSTKMIYRFLEDMYACPHCESIWTPEQLATGEQQGGQDG